jgi:dTMP kinase
VAASPTGVSKSHALAPAESLPGTFIALEGVDGSGKTTVGERLASAARAAGLDVVFTREPGGTPIGEQIRALLLGAGASDMAPETEVLLFAAARAQHVAQVIRPALARGALVITDRYIDSSLAYQWGGRGIPREMIAAAQNVAGATLHPKLTLLFDLPVDVALGRRFAAEGEANRLDQEAVEFHERVRAAYRRLAAEEPARWRVIDATGSPDEAWRQVVAALHDAELLPVEICVGSLEAKPGRPA